MVLIHSWKSILYIRHSSTTKRLAQLIKFCNSLSSAKSIPVLVDTPSKADPNQWLYNESPKRIWTTEISADISTTFPTTPEHLCTSSAKSVAGLLSERPWTAPNSFRHSAQPKKRQQFTEIKSINRIRSHISWDDKRKNSDLCILARKANWIYICSPPSFLNHANQSLSEVIPVKHYQQNLDKVTARNGKKTRICTEINMLQGS